MRAPVALAALLTACSSPAPQEAITIMFTPSIEKAHYRTFAFDEERCVDFHDVRLDSELIRKTMLETLAAELPKHGFVPSDPASADVLIHYRVALLDGGDQPGVSERTLGQLIAVDAGSRRVVWVGERKAPFVRIGTREEVEEEVRQHVRELLSYTEPFKKWGVAQ